MVEGANSFFRSTALENDDAIRFALSDNGTYICTNLYSSVLPKL